MIQSSATIESAIAMLALTKRGIFFSVVFQELEFEAVLSRVKLFKPDIILTKNKIVAKRLKAHKVRNLKVDNLTKYNLLNRPINKKFIKTIYIDSNKDFFCLFTSGSTGTPKGIVHNYGGYSIYAKFTCEHQFGMDQSSIVLTGSDAGWINGHTYSLFGPLFFGATTILCESPMILINKKILLDLIKSLKVSVLYLPVTIIRLLKSIFKKISFKSNSIKTLGSMGEPLAPTVGSWFADNFNNKRNAIVNTYFQTETGGIIASPNFLDKANNQTHGSVGEVACKFLSYKKLNDYKKKEFILTQPWPGCMKRVLNGSKEWKKYWTKNGNFRMFDMATKKNNLIYIHGRTDDVINIRGHRIGSGEFESVILKIKEIQECCAIAIPDKLEGNIFFLFAVSKDKPDSKIFKVINSNFGSFAIPKKIFYIPELPKTRSGKILRRLLRSLLLNKNVLGDTSTMINPAIVKKIKIVLNEYNKT